MKLITFRKAKVVYADNERLQITSKNKDLVLMATVGFGDFSSLHNKHVNVTIEVIE